MKQLFGWRKDKYDDRDYLHKIRVPLRELPEVIVLDKYLPQVRDQGMVGSCVGFSFGANLTAWSKKLGVFVEWFSPTWIYNGARFIEGTLNYDAGCFPRDACKWLKMKGCLLEHFWPYDPAELDTTSPPTRLEPEAARYPLLAYYRVTDDVDGICSAIADGYYVSIGTPWFYKWLNTDKEGRLSEVKSSDSLAGGHATCLYGYDRARQLFYGINSWGELWGNKGFFLMPFSAFSVFKKLGGYDAYYVVVDWAEVPPQPPEPPQPEGGFGFRVQYSTDNKNTWKTIFEI
jgi:hypothetical protein